MSTMDLRLTEDQEQLRSSLRAFCNNEIAPHAAERDETGRFEDGLIEKLAGMGLFGLYVPEEYGGAGLDVVSYVMMVDELSRACAATGILVSAHHSLCVDPILNFGSEEQKRKYLPKLSSGEWIGCFSLTEPGSGSDAGAARCSAVLKGDEWHVNGTKCFVTNGREASVCVLFAVTAPPGEKKNRMSAFIVEKNNTPGLTVGKAEKKMGIKASSTTELIFENAVLPKDALLGEVGKGLNIALATLDGGRLGVAAQATGICQAALDAALKYSMTRHQFNQPIANFQAIQWKLADMQVGIDAARMLLYRGAWLKSNKRPFGGEASMAKLFASELSARVCNMAVQVFGGWGYCWEYGVERLMRDSKITELYEGTSEIQRLVIARKLLTDPQWAISA
jgi:butyryl-CoA dehydrogenase